MRLHKPCKQYSAFPPHHAEDRRSASSAEIAQPAERGFAAPGAQATSLVLRQSSEVPDRLVWNSRHAAVALFQRSSESALVGDHATATRDAAVRTAIARAASSSPSRASRGGSAASRSKT